MASDLYDKFFMITEFCLSHEKNEIEIYCSCHSKLCKMCLGDHYHENICFSSIYAAVQTFNLEVNENLQMINEMESKYEIQGISKQERFKTLIEALREIAKSIKRLINTKIYITYDQVINFKKLKFKEKICEIINTFYFKDSEEKRNAIDYLIKSKISFDKPAKLEKKKEKEEKIISPSNSMLARESANLLKCTLTISNIKMSTSKKSSSIFESNKENINPLFDIRQEISSPKVEPFSTLCPIQTIKKFELSTLTNKSRFQKKNNKINSAFFHKDPLNYNYNFENQNDFLGSSNSKLKKTSKNTDNMVKIVCITCRDKFTVAKEHTNWRMRCDVCTRNNLEY